ncbi:uncharacterized protein BN777_01708 [Bacteroides sp. CAG:770]|nr:uncharacterized protein BN777_01708 [Bacteroides sp. CAG:770]
MLAVASVCCACGDLKDRVDVLEQKVSALESKVNQNVNSINALVDAAKKAVTITKVETLTDGYKIYFSDGTISTISNGVNGTDGKDGVDGKDAVAPVIGIKEEEGVYYWTIDGEFVLNNGQKVPVTGKDGLTPQFKIQDGKWYVSFDGNTWNAVPVTGTEKPELVMSETDDEYVFTLGETTIRIAKEHAFMIKVTSDVQKVTPGEVVSFGYTVTGADATTHVIIEANGVEAQLDEEKSLVTVTVPSVIEDNSYVMVKAIRNSDGKYSAQYITIKLNQYGTFGGVIVVDEDEYLNW